MCVHVYTTCIYKNILEPVYITFPLRLSPHHPRKQKNGPYEGKVVGGQETSQVFSVIDRSLRFPLALRFYESNWKPS